jgi:hypothetical protein
MIVTMYSLYLALSIALTIWVARTLFTNGQVFLLEVFDGDQALATSVNHLLVVGFYLINLGFVSLTLKTTAEVPDTRACIEMLATKVGLVLLTLGGMHFFNLLIFNKIRHRGATQYTNLPGGFVAGRHHM